MSTERSRSLSSKDEGGTGRYPGTDMDRRTFLKAAGTAALLAGCRKRGRGPAPEAASQVREEPGATASRPGPVDAGAAERAASDQPCTRGIAGRGQVFVARNPHALDARGMPASAPVAEMLDWLVRELVGESKVLDCWARLFSPKDVVGIKPNAFATTWCSPSPALVLAIIERLHAIGIPYEHIHVWDHWNFRRAPVYRALLRSPVKPRRQKEIGYDSRVIRLPSGGWTKVNRLVPQLTAIVNVPVFKDHDLAGVTCAMKNLALGSVSNPAAHHPNSCTPGVPEIYALPELGGKVRLIVADAFRVIYDKGPFGAKSRRTNAAHHSLYVSRDPVALDRICWDVVDRYRKAKGLPLLMDRGRGRRKVGRPIHVLHAGKMGLGEAEFAKIKLHEKDFG